MSVAETSGELTGARTIEDATCTRCSCICDDIILRIQGQRITAADRACQLGADWFLKPRNDNCSECLIDGQSAERAAGIEKAAQLLAGAKYPLVYGLSETTTESQCVAVGIADWIGANLDTPTSVLHGPSGVTFQGVGEVTCSLGEVRNRGDLIIFWGSDPATSHPRHFERYSLEPTGLFVPQGRADRTCVVIDVRETETVKQADLFLKIKPGSDFEVAWVLRALAAGIAIDAEQVEAATGQPLSVWQDLADRMKAAKFGVIFYGLGVSLTRGKHVNSEAIAALTRDLNKYTRFTCRPNRGGGNITGADNVVTWRTGYPFGVNLSRGYPRFNPGEYTVADVLARGEADAALILASDPLTDLPSAARKHLASIPTIILSPNDTPIFRTATVAFTTATYGINEPGTVYRMDDVPIPLRPALESSFPSDFEILSGLENRVKQLKAAGFAEANQRSVVAAH